MAGFSYSRCERTADGYKFTLTHDMKYKVTQMVDQPNMKSWWCGHLTQLENSPVVAPVFRFRFERVSNTNKLQKPYSFTRFAVQLQPKMAVCLTPPAAA